MLESIVIRHRDSKTREGSCSSSFSGVDKRVEHMRANSVEADGVITATACLQPKEL